ncbi:DUF1800 domain-containing protein [Lutibacter sp.]|uniref:DUF1800 domain-containing protein n=1 Tax=Lutibacter sp. TaxID=1925666 RepID=UPI0025C0BD14|nr:DUF1800 domain-containing protein [Lutibacter sp.]MCF6168127.1 DUF1800 domain-containing protein [Lutibacter sp.]
MSCNSGSINEFVPTPSNPWNKRRIQHFYKRAGFGTNTNEIEQALVLAPSNFVENTINEAVNSPSVSPPSWFEMVESDYTNIDEQMQEQHKELYVIWGKEMLENPIRGRFTLFWSNHFVTRLEDYWCSSWMYNYYSILQQYAFGNFKEFVKAIGLSPAMLIFLNGYQNSATEPNENYARELYELFTLGVNNGYTQNDIVETAKALTGYTAINEYCAPIGFDINDFDNSSKTIFGKTGDWGYNDVINILFEERGNEVATFICEKLYKYFVSPEVDSTIVSKLATTFVANNFELAPVYKQLFKSEHFFDDNAIGIVIKSPFDVLNIYFRETGFATNAELLLNVIWLTSEIGQTLFEPIDVAGWQGNHDWINSSTLVGRWNAFEYYLWWIWENHNGSLRDFAVNLAGESNDPSIITKIIVDHLLPNGLQTETDYGIATDVFKDQVPQNYFDNGTWNLQWDTVPYQVIVLLLYIVRLPEFQLK